MIELSNRHRLEFVAASGSLAFDGRGWPWEWPLRWVGLLDPRLFTIVTKTIFLNPYKGNRSLIVPWRVIKFVSEKGETIPLLLGLIKPELVAGIVNAEGLRGPGLEGWLKRDYPVIRRFGYKVIVSITGKEIKDCVAMTKRLNGLENIVGLELNASCPSENPLFLERPEIIPQFCNDIHQVSDLPLLLKLSYAQPYLKIAKETENIIEAISINTVSWNIVFPDKESHLARYGGGGVSGRVARQFTWKMVSELARGTKTPVIGPTIWEYEDIWKLWSLGASAYHFGTIFLLYPWRPTTYVKRWRREQEGR